MARPTRTQVNELERRRLQAPGGAPQAFFRPARPPRGVEGGADFSALSQSLTGLMRTLQREQTEEDKENLEKGRIEAEANRSKSISEWSKIDPEANVYRSIGNLQGTGANAADIYQEELNARRAEAVQLANEPDENGIPQRETPPEEILSQAWEATVEKFKEAGREDLLDNYYFRKGLSSRRSAVENSFLQQITQEYEVNKKKRANNLLSQDAAKNVQAAQYSAVEKNGGTEYDPNAKKAFEQLMTEAKTRGVSDPAGVAYGAVMTIVDEVSTEEGKAEAAALLDFYSTAVVDGVPLNRHDKYGQMIAQKQSKLAKEEEEDAGKEVRERTAQLKKVVQEYFDSDEGKSLLDQRVVGDQAYLDAVSAAIKVVAADPKYSPAEAKAIIDTLDDEVAATRRNPSPNENAITAFFTHLNKGEFDEARKQIRYAPPNDQMSLWKAYDQRVANQNETTNSRVYNGFVSDLESQGKSLQDEFKHFSADEREAINKQINTATTTVTQQYVAEVDRLKKQGMTSVAIDDAMSKWVREKNSEIQEVRDKVYEEWIKPRQDIYNRLSEMSLTGEDPTEDPDFNKLPKSEQHQLRKDSTAVNRDRTTKTTREIDLFAHDLKREIESSLNPEYVELRIKRAGADEDEKGSAATELFRRETTVRRAFEAELKEWLQDDKTKKMGFDQFTRALEAKKDELRDKFFNPLRGASSEAEEEATRRGEDSTELIEAREIQNAFMRSIREGTLGSSFNIAGRAVPLFMKHETADWLFSRDYKAFLGRRTATTSDLTGQRTEAVYAKPSPFTQTISQMYQADTPGARESHRAKVLRDRGLILGAIISNPMDAQFLKNRASRNRGLRKTWNAVARHTGISVDQVLRGSADVKINGKNHVIPVDMNYVEPAITPLFLDDKGRPSFESMERFVTGVRSGDQATIAQAKRLMDKLNWPYDKSAAYIHNDPGFRSLIQRQGFAIKNVTGGR